MIVRSYSGRTMAEALQKVRADLGASALIIESRSVKSPGLFGQKIGCEVVAASDDREQAVPRRTLADAMAKATVPAPTKPAGQADGLRRLRERSETVESVGEARLQHELSAIRDQLRRLASGQKTATNHLGELAEMLTAQELPDDLLAELDQALASAGTRLDCAHREEFLRRWLDRGLPCANGIDWNAVRCLMVVGPTGVGKTTTIAKLAGELVLKRRRKVAIATIDTYRVGATDQLRAYADLLDIPLEVAQTPAQLHQIISGFADYDNVLIDTAGRSPADAARVHELKGFCRAAPADGAMRLGVMLAMSATAGRAEFAAVVERFSVLPLEHYVVTKLDECAAVGRLYGCLRRHHLSPAYVSTGQEVPADITVADPRLLSDRLIPRPALVEGA